MIHCHKSFISRVLMKLTRRSLPPRQRFEICYTIQEPLGHAGFASSKFVSLLSSFKIVLNDFQNGKHDIAVELAYGSRDDELFIARRLKGCLEDNDLDSIRPLLMYDEIIILLRHWLLTEGSSIAFSTTGYDIRYPYAEHDDFKPTSEMVDQHLRKMKALKTSNMKPLEQPDWPHPYYM